MTTKLTELPTVFKDANVVMIGDKERGRVAVIDQNLNSTGHDIALFFSDAEKARAYRDHYPSLRDYGIISSTVAAMIELFDGRVEYFIVDRPPGD